MSEVIGPAGKVIKKIVAMTGAKIDIEDDGKITVASADVTAAEKAMQMIRDITAEAEIGKTYTGRVIRLEEYGAFVEILPNVVGLLHISEVAPYRIKSIHDRHQNGTGADRQVHQHRRGQQGPGEPEGLGGPRLLDGSHRRGPGPK